MRVAIDRMLASGLYACFEEVVFSTVPCEYCRSTLSGRRYGIHGYESCDESQRDNMLIVHICADCVDHFLES